MKPAAPAAAVFACLAAAAFSQELEPRRWGHLPTGANFTGLGYARTDGEIALDPVLRITDGTFDLQTAALKYIRSFALMDKSARFEITQAYQSGSWSGVLDGTPTTVERDGWGDTSMRFAVNLWGAPPREGREFRDYRKSVAACETIVGAGLVVMLPTGEYLDDRLINLGANRFTFRPQVGMVHSRGPWSIECTGSLWFFTDNDEFWNGNRLEQDPLVAMQSHLIYTFLPGLWLGASAGYATAGETTINGISKDDARNQFSWALSLGVPLHPQAGLKLAYIGSRTGERIGTDSDTLALALSVLW